jgi:hypothetical protein
MISIEVVSDEGAVTPSAQTVTLNSPSLGKTDPSVTTISTALELNPVDTVVFALFLVFKKLIS